jgi:hypothetical protein
MLRFISVILVVTLAACSDPAETPSTADAANAGVLDMGVLEDLAGGESPDTGSDQTRDAGATDSSTPDTGSADVEPDVPNPILDEAADPGFGDITGNCGTLDIELTSSRPFFFVNAIDFGTDPYDEADESQLTTGGKAIVAAGNLNDSSLLSEVFAYEVLARCEGAVFLKGEADITYVNAQGKKTDVLVEIDGETIGVSVTRALRFPFDDPYTVMHANELLSDKLQGVLESSANVADSDAWTKQILHVMAYAPGHAESLRTAWDGLPADVRADTIVFVSVTNGDDGFMY